MATPDTANITSENKTWINVNQTGALYVRYTIIPTYNEIILAYKIAPKYLSLGLPLNKIIQYNAGMFTITLIKSISPNGEKRLTKNTPIIFPTNPSYGKIMHIPTTISAIRN